MFSLTVSHKNACGWGHRGGLVQSLSNVQSGPEQPITLTLTHLADKSVIKVFNFRLSHSFFRSHEWLFFKHPIFSKKVIFYLKIGPNSNQYVLFHFILVRKQSSSLIYIILCYRTLLSYYSNPFNLCELAYFDPPRLRHFSLKGIFFLDWNLIVRKRSYIIARLFMLL